MDGVGGRRRIAAKSSAEDQALDQIAKEVSHPVDSTHRRSFNKSVLLHIFIYRISSEMERI
jgi:hypothetical protein